MLPNVRRNIIRMLLAVIIVVITVGVVVSTGHGDDMMNVGSYFGYFVLVLFGVMVLALVVVLLKKVGQLLGLVKHNP